jgi:outer membrane protein assembly factor BamA
MLVTCALLAHTVPAWAEREGATEPSARDARVPTDPRRQPEPAESTEPAPPDSAGEAASGNDEREHPTPEEIVRRYARPPLIRKVLISGNHKIEEEDLIEGLATRGEHGWWLWHHEYPIDTVALDRDRDRIATFYHEHGYFAAEVRDVEVREVGKDRVDIIYHVFEGRPSILTDIVIEGAPERPTGKLARDVADRPAVHEEALRRLVGLPVGKRFIYEKYDLSKEIIGQALRLAGFAHAQVRGKVAVDRVSERVGVRYEIQPGPRVRFGNTRVNGLDALPDSVVHNRVAWSPGEVFDPGKVAETRRSLQSLRRFQTVRIDLADRDPSAIEDIRITAVEAPPRELRFGFGVGVDPARWELRGRAGYRVFGVPDALSTSSIELRPAYANLRAVADDDSGGFVGEATVAVVRDDFLLPLLRGETEAAYTVDEYEAYASRGGRFRLGLNRSWFDQRLRTSANWQLLLLEFHNVSGGIGLARQEEFGLTGPYQLGMFEQTIAYDIRDNPLDARRGIYAELRMREAGRYSASEFSFITMTPELRGYLSVTEQLTLAARVRYGRLITGDGLPITERYFSGGASNHRGFPQRRLSPSDPDRPPFKPDENPDDDKPPAVNGPVAVGGEALLEASLEARMDLFHLREEWFGVVVFTDAGRVTTRPEYLDPFEVNELFWAAGAGLRYNTPVGPLRFDLGYRLNRHNQLELVSDDTVWDRVAFHLSIGEAF